MIQRLKKPIIAVDIDDVLADSASRFIEYSNKTWGTSLTIDDYSEDWSSLWGIDDKETEMRSVQYFSSGIVNLYDHDNEAVSVFLKLKKKYDLILVTSRSILLKEDTIIWINLKYPGVFRSQDIYFSGIWDNGVSGVAVSSNKGQIVKDLGVKYIIDDQVKHCVGAYNHGIKALLFGDYSWNRKEILPKGIIRVSDWSEVLKYFEKQTI